jgi:prepilin-type N-terminal cleavage/methylation domain-containing protein
MTKFMPQRGFVLIEVAIALLVLALILGGILAPLNAQVEQGKIRDTNKVISDINEALLGYVMINGRLPRPATSSTNGVENASACASETACTGFIPWTTLGSGKLDAWGNIIRYSVTPAFANSAFALTTVGTKTIQERNAASALVSYATLVPVVVWSNGPENFGTNGTAAVRANNSSGVTNADEITNNTASTTFIRRIQVNNSAATGGEFDDIVTFIPTAILVNKAIAAGKLP